MCKVILASKSPRRKELLKLIFDKFEICPDDTPENADKNLSPDKFVLKLAEDKCINVAEKFSEDYLVIGSDTVVVKDGKILGKPKDEEDAIKMLKILRNSVHSVYTGVCVCVKKQDKKEIFYEKTDVYFYDISDEDIERYVHTGEPMDKAGAYGIQEKGSLFVKRIDGDYNNVVGLPVAKLNKILKEKFEF